MSDNIKPDIIYESGIDEKLDAAIRKSLCICFPWDKHFYEKIRPWHGIIPLYTAVIREDGDVIAHAAIVDTNIEVGGKKLRVAGLQNVFVLPEYRKKGLSDVILRSVMQHAQNHDFDVGLLFTSSAPVVKVYARNGWIEIKNQQFYKIEDSQKVLMPKSKHKMFYPLKLREFPEGIVELTTNDW